MPGILLPEFYFVLILLIVFSAIATRSRSLNKVGLMVGILVGLIAYYFGGIESFFILLVFFLVGESATRISRQISGSKEHEQRGIQNIFGNVGPGLILLMIRPASMSVAFFSVVSAALGDTLAGEIGRLSKQTPRMITPPFQKVEKGTDGGITILGLLASIFGGLVVGAVYYLITRDIYLSSLIVFAGLFGSILDSIIGATLQDAGLLDNNQVNFLAMLITGIILSIIGM